MKSSFGKLLLIFALSSARLAAEEFDALVFPIDKTIKKRMLKGHSWREGCPVGTEALRYIILNYHGFDGRVHLGEIIVHRDAVESTISVFKELFTIGYPIRKMRLVSDFLGKDWRSIEADNTTAFNCRRVAGKSAWSNHAYGKAIDINPLENPYISQNGHIAHKASHKFAKRLHRPQRGTPDKALITKKDKAYKIFKNHGWVWGGEWHGAKDYQHFEYLGDLTDYYSPNE